MVRTIEIERKVGPKGQVVIPKEIRRTLGVMPEMKVYVGLEDRKIIIRPEKEGAVKEFINLIPPEKRKVITIKEIKKSYEEELEEKWRKIK